MGIKVTREFSLEHEGKTVVFSPEVDKIAESRWIGLVCDSPRCAARHDGKSTFLTWDEILAEKDPASLPSGFESIIKIYPDPLNAEHVVYLCGPACAKDFLTYAYQPPKSVKQILEEREAALKVNPAAQKAIDEANPQMTLPFGEPTEFAAQTVEAVEDSTGYPN